MGKRNRSQYEADVEDVYSSSDLARARIVMLEETSKGRMRQISQRHFLSRSANVWEGPEGMMEHAILRFPMPHLIAPKATEESNKNRGEDSKDNVQTNDEPSSSGSKQSKKSLSTAHNVISETDSNIENAEKVWVSAATISSVDHSLPSESKQEAQKVTIEITSSSVKNIDLKDINETETAVDGELLSEDEKQSEGAGDSVYVLKSNKKKLKIHLVAWQQLIEMYEELLEIQNPPNLGELVDTCFRDHKVQQKKRVLVLGKRIKNAITKAKVRPTDSVPPKVKKRMDLSHDLKVSEITKLLASVKRSVHEHSTPDAVSKTDVDTETDDSYSELDHWVNVVSIYKDGLEIKKVLENPVFDSHWPSKGEFISLGRKLKQLEPKFRNARKKSTFKGFSKDMSSSIKEMLKLSNSLTMDEVSDCIIYVRNLLTDQRQSLAAYKNEKHNGRQNQNPTTECFTVLSKIFRKYKIIGGKLRLDLNIKAGEQVILADEKLSAVIKIKEQLKELDEEFRDIDYGKQHIGKKHRKKNGSGKVGIAKLYNDVHNMKVNVVRSFDALLSRVVNPEQLQ